MPGRRSRCLDMRGARSGHRLIERDRGHRGARRAPDERAWFCGQGLDAAPLGHEYFELAPFRLCVALVEGYHLRVVLPDGADLVTVLDDHAVAGEDQPASSGDLR